MIRDRRFYKRLEMMGTPILIYPMNSQEITGSITDISEESIGIEIPVADKMKLASHGTFRFQFVDKYRQGNKQKTKVITALAIIIRHEDAGDVCHLGCVVRDEKYRAYAVKRKFSVYFNKMEMKYEKAKKQRVLHIGEK